MPRGIDLVDRLAQALGTTIADLLPSSPPLDFTERMDNQSRRFLDRILQSADKDTLLLLNPLLTMFAERPARNC